MKKRFKKDKFNFDEWKIIRERGFIRYVYKWNLLAVVLTLISLIFFSSRTWIEIIVMEIFLLISITLSSYFEWWENEERYNAELNNEESNNEND